MNADRQRLKLAARDLVRAVGGQVDATGHSRIKRHQQFSAYGSNSAEHAETWMPADVVADLESVCRGAEGHPHVTRELARQQGYILVRLPDPGASADGLRQSVLELSRELGDVAGAIADALADLQCHPREAQRILDEVNQLDAASSSLRSQLMALAYPPERGSSASEARA